MKSKGSKVDTDRHDSTPKKGKRLRDWKPLFLEGLRQSGTIKTACEVACISRSTPYSEAKGNPDFAVQWEEALREWGTFFESERLDWLREAQDTAMSGLLAAAKEGNPTVLIFLAKAVLGLKEGTVLELSGPNGGPISLQAEREETYPGLKLLTEDEREDLGYFLRIGRGLHSPEEIEEMRRRRHERIKATLV